MELNLYSLYTSSWRGQEQFYFFCTLLVLFSRTTCFCRQVVYTQIDKHFKVINIKIINRIVTGIASYFALNCRQGFLIDCIEFEYFLCVLYNIVRIASLGFVFLGCLCVFVRCLRVGRSDESLFIE